MTDSSDVVSFEFARSELVMTLDEAVRVIASGKPMAFSQLRRVSMHLKRYLSSCHREPAMWAAIQRLADDGGGAIDELLQDEIAGCQVLIDADHRGVDVVAREWNQKLGRHQLGLVLAAVNRLNDLRGPMSGLVGEPPTGTPGYLDLIVDFERKIVRRVGADIPVDLSRKPVVWELFVALVRAAGNELGMERVKALPGESGNPRSQAKKSLTSLLQPLGIVVTGNRSDKWKLVEET